MNVTPFRAPIAYHFRGTGSRPHRRLQFGHLKSATRSNTDVGRAAQPESLDKKQLRYEQVAACWSDHANYLRTICWRAGVPEQDHDDLIQEVLTIALQRRNVRDVKKWAVGTLRRQIIMYYRRGRRHFTRFVPLEPVVVDFVTEAKLRLEIDREIGFWHSRLDINRALQEFTPRMQLLIVMRAQGHNDNAIASATYYQPTSVRKLYNRALRRLGESLTQQAVITHRGQQ